MKVLYRVWVEVPNIIVDSVYSKIENIELLYNMVNYSFNKELTREVLYIDDNDDAKLFLKAAEELKLPNDVKDILNFIVERQYDFVLTWVKQYVL